MFQVVWKKYLTSQDRDQNDLGRPSAKSASPIVSGVSADLPFQQVVDISSSERFERNTWLLRTRIKMAWDVHQLNPHLLYHKRPHFSRQALFTTAARKDLQKRHKTWFISEDPIQGHYFFLKHNLGWTYFVLNKRSFTFQLFIWTAFISLLQDDKGRQFVTKFFKAPFGSDSHAPQQSIWNKVQWIERIRIEQNWNPCIGIFHRLLN